MVYLDGGANARDPGLAHLPHGKLALFTLADKEAAATAHSVECSKLDAVGPAKKVRRDKRIGWVSLAVRSVASLAVDEVDQRDGHHRDTRVIELS